MSRTGSGPVGRRRLAVPPRLAPASAPWVGVAELTLAMAMVATNFLASRVVTETLPVMLASTVRYLLATLLLLPVLLLSRPVPRPSRRTWGLLLGVSAGGTLIFNLGLLFGLRYTTVVEAGVVTSLTPVLVGLLGLALFRERLTGRSWGATVAVTAGVLLVVVEPGSGDDGAGGWWRVLGLGLILVGAAGEALFNVFGRKLPPGLPSVAASTYVMAIGTLLFLPGAVVEFARTPSVPMDPGGWLAVVWLAIVPTVLGLLFWVDGIRRVSLGTAGAMTALIPCFTTVYAVLLLGEDLSSAEGAGILIVVAALVVMARVGHGGVTDSS